MAEQRYRAVPAVISDGRTIKEVAAAVGVKLVVGLVFGIPIAVIMSAIGSASS